MRLYRISGSGDSYSFLEYKCPNLKGRFNIPIPDEIIDNEFIDDDDIDYLCDVGLIDTVVYDTIVWGLDDTAYMIATETKEGDYLCYRLLCKDGRLIGRMPTIFDKYWDKYRWPICFVISVIFLCFIAKWFW